jgi:hypothetical protein
MVHNQLNNFFNEKMRKYRRCDLNWIFFSKIWKNFNKKFLLLLYSAFNLNNLFLNHHKL